MEQLDITLPDDWHLHLRDEAALKTVVPHAAARFGRAIVMPNLKPPITDTNQARAYRSRILAALPEGMSFTPLMTLYLTDRTDPDEIIRAKKSGVVYGVKLYPAGATTHSEAGVTDLWSLTDTLEAMAEVGLPLLIHGEVTDPDVDIFDRERVFLERVLAPLLDRIPRLKVVLEHITTREAAEFVRSTDDRVAATITPHHLLMNRNSLLVGGIRPHHYCLPILKRETHREALVEAAVSGNPKFFLGTDSAPHPRSAKESACGCAGIYSVHAAIELYAEVFDDVGALDRLEGFAGFHGPDFYGLPRNRGRLKLVRESQAVPDGFPFGDDVVVPLRAGGVIRWRIAERTE